MLLKPFFHLLILTLSAAVNLAVPLTSLPADAVALLAFKSKSDLDKKLLYATNERFDYCQWQGVKCAQGRVVRYAVQSLGLRGTVAPATLSRLDQLRTLSLRNNSLSGPLPDLSTLVNLKTVSFDHNYFTGTFPFSILSLHGLLLLDLSHNTLTGPLPDNLTVLDRLGYLRLDSNQFSGPIPPLNQTTLQVFNISNNNLTGPIPITPTLRKFPVFSYLYNPKLCGEVLNKPCRGYPFFNSSGAGDDPSPPTPLLQNAQSQQGSTDISHSPQKNHRKNVGLVLGLVTGTLILTAAILSIVALIRKRREEYEEREEMKGKPETIVSDLTTNNKAPRDENANSENPEAKKLQTAVMKSGNLVFCSGEDGLYTLDQLMRASAELLGRGTIGTTYKAVMANQFIVSVKRLDACKTAITSGDQFEQYMESVGVLRHPNLVPVRAYFQAQQERLIIFDYQPNGSLFNLIHGSRSTRTKPLHWTSCLKIAEDIAQGLAYIHQASKFVHGNLKSSNVLLGPDFEACLTDYCLAALADTSLDDDSDFAGYRAPEIRKSARGATAKSDVYAFGVLLLELLTGKPPSQHPFLAPPDMPDWVRAMRDDDSEDDIRLRMLVEVASICSLTSPEQRPTMWQVLKMITNVKEIMDDSADGDAVSIFGSSHIWVDHNSLSNCADGLVDAVMGSTAITISNNYFTHHNEVMLLGHSDSYTRDKQMQVTIAFNHFGEGLIQRMPRCRHGYFHVVNNDYTHWEMYAIGGSAQPTINSQGNRYLAPVNPFAKEVTKRVDTADSQWKGWNWRSEGDLMLNGAYFTPSGAGAAASYARASSLGAKPSSMVGPITSGAGALGCRRGRRC